MLKNNIQSGKAPKAIGPYSQGIEINDFVFMSGQIGIDPDTGKMEEGIKRQTGQIFENLKNVIKASGGVLDDIVKTTVYMADLSEFEEMNKVYEKFFNKPYPARATVQVAKLPRGAKVEIEAVAYIK